MITIYELRGDDRVETCYVDIESYDGDLIYFKQEDDWVILTKADVLRLAECVINEDTIFHQ